jgi:hypothetical protein
MRAGPGRWVGLLTRVALLAVTIWGSNLWLVHIRDSLAAHRSLLVGQPALAESTSPLVQQAVIVLVSGLTYDASLEMPFLNDLREQGLDARCRGYYPSYTQSAWTTIISGASPEISDAPLLDLPYDQLRFLTVDGLFIDAKRANLRTGLAGFHWWERMVQEAALDYGFFVTATNAEADAQVAEAAVGFMSDLPPNLLLIQFGQVDHAARTYGTDSPQYRDAVQSADSHLRTIAQAVSLSRNVLVVASDHGYLADGGHGGADQEVIITPFVMAGARIIPGTEGELDQTDVAPTIAALLGLAVPSAAQGEILYDFLALDEGESTEKWVAWAQQRVELSDVYLQSLGQPGVSAGSRGDAEVARSSLLVRNYTSARRLATFAVQGATAEMVKARAQRIASDQTRRLPLAAIPVLGATYLLWRRWTRTTAALFFSALGSVVIYHLLFVWEGEVYSFSTIGPWEDFVTETLLRLATALLPALPVIVWLAWRQPRRRPSQLGSLNYSFALLLLSVLALPLAVSYVLNGFRVTWRLPDPLFAFLQVSSLLQLGLAAFFTLFLPLFTIPLDRMLRWVAAKANLAKV